MNTYILLWLEGVLQSWGYDSKFFNRNTLEFPTRSGILGLLLSSMGKTEKQNDLLAKFIGLDQTIISFSKDTVTLKDFHMVGSKYDENDPWQKMCIPKTSDGKKAVGGGTKLTYRYYLQNSKYAVILEVPPEIKDDCIKGLMKPVFDTYLGRKNCVPSEFIYQGEFNSSEEAISKAEKIAEEKKLTANFKVYNKQENDELKEKRSSFFLNDIPIQFGSQKKYRDRYVTIAYE